MLPAETNSTTDCRNSGLHGFLTCEDSLMWLLKRTGHSPFSSVLYLNPHGRNNLKFCITDRIITLIFFSAKKLESMGNNGIILSSNASVENVYIGALVSNSTGIPGDFSIVMPSSSNNTYRFKTMLYLPTFSEI